LVVPGIISTLRKKVRMSPDRVGPRNSYVPGTDSGLVLLVLCRSTMTARSSSTTNLVQDILFSTSFLEYPMVFSKLAFTDRTVVSSARIMLAVAVCSKIAR